MPSHVWIMDAIRISMRIGPLPYLHQGMCLFSKSGRPRLPSNNPIVRTIFI